MKQSFALSTCIVETISQGNGMQLSVVVCEDTVDNNEHVTKN